MRDKNERCAQCGAVNRTHGSPCIDAAPTLIHDYADLLDDAPDMYRRAHESGVEAALDSVIAELSKARTDEGHTAGWYDAFGVAIDVVKGMR